MSLCAQAAGYSVFDLIRLLGLSLQGAAAGSKPHSERLNAATATSIRISEAKRGGLSAATQSASAEKLHLIERLQG